MSKQAKLIARLTSKPKDFTFQELGTLLKGLGYRVSHAGKTSGSAIKFVHEMYPMIRLHKPHPSPIVKAYVIEAVLDVLKNEGLL